VNKAQLVEALAARLGDDKKSAAASVDALVDTVIRTVSKGEKVSITGFGVFEKRARAARTARNPATGDTVKLKKTSVPAFRAGQGFKEVVAGTKKLAKVAAPARSATASVSKNTAKRTTAKTTARKSAAKKTTARASAARKTAAKRAPARKATARRTSSRRSR